MFVANVAWGLFHKIGSQQEPQIGSHWELQLQRELILWNTYCFFWLRFSGELQFRVAVLVWRCGSQQETQIGQVFNENRFSKKPIICYGTPPIFSWVSQENQKSVLVENCPKVVVLKENRFSVLVENQFYGTALCAPRSNLKCTFICKTLHKAHAARTWYSYNLLEDNLRCWVRVERILLHPPSAHCRQDDRPSINMPQVVTPLCRRLAWPVACAAGARHRRRGQMC